MNEQTLTVGLDERSYPIFIGSNVLASVAPRLEAHPVGKRYAIISDETVAGIYGQRLLDALTKAGIGCSLITFPAGEEHKTSSTVTRLASELAQQGFDRGDALIALGGGVVGDITGFLASIYMRGIPFVQIPTTLLSQVDSSVGGKTGVDIPEGKNLIGTFYQPRAVFIDIDVLATLPEQELRGGLAEVIKYGVILDAAFFQRLLEQREQILDLEPSALIPMIRTCCAIKAQVVEEDEREGGLRRILNFGHTIGHAVEAASGFEIIHGFAVAIGMQAAAELAGLADYGDARVAVAIREILEAYGLPTEIPSSLDRAMIRRYLLSDKKTVDGRIFFVLPTTIGRVTVTDQVAEEAIDAVLNRE
ncbi:3-dehydroquinate synthase [Desulfogranum mediterraneum]|uniref:3-dehydroquinate synthase n=1 Tax=Desulfogranum mediterraneum TaxID=160661 RepID=UPI00048FC9C0|nr:3-dehydroquinate synthase [Desulfogranum mediterraneum]